MKDPPQPEDESVRAAQAPPVSRRDARLVGAGLVAAGAWSAELGLCYALVPPAAHAGSKALLWGVTAATSAMVVFSGLLAYRELRHPEREAAASSRTRALAGAACALSLFFLLAIVAEAIPMLALGLDAK